MNTSLRRVSCCWILVLSCLMLCAARAQDVQPDAAAPPSGATDQNVPGARRHYHHGHQDGDVVSIGHRAELAEGERADGVVAIFGSAISAGDVNDSVVSVMGNGRVTGHVGDSVVAVMGSLYVNSEVEGNVVDIFGNLELGPEARIHGDVVVVAGGITRDPNAQVDGHVQTIVATDLNDLGWLKPWIERCLLYGRPLAWVPGVGWAWGVALGFLALYLFLALLFRGAVERCVATLESAPGRSILAALLAVFLTPVVFVLLCVTVLGILAVPFLAIGLLCAAVFGKLVVLAAIGRRCTPFLARSPLAHTLIGVLLGAAIVSVLYTIPIMGFLLYKALEILGLGVVLLTLIQGMRAGRAARDGGVESVLRAPPGAVPVGATEATPGAAGGVRDPELPASSSAASAREAPDPAPGPAPYIKSVSLPRAGFWIRMGALALDAILVGIVIHLTEAPIHLARVDVNLNLLVLAVYAAVMWKLKESTVGGIICGLQVVRLDGRPVDWATAIVRALACFLSLAIVGLGFLWIAIDPESQAWHDKIAGTVVVRAPKGASLL